MDQEYELLHPPNSEIATVLQDVLLRSFSHVKVEVLERCPDLSQQPWNLVNSGLCGSPKLIELGGVPNLLPMVNKSKRYDLLDVLKRNLHDDATGLLIGAGAAPFWQMRDGVNGELVVNQSRSKNWSKVSSVNVVDGACITEAAPSSHSSLLGNYLCCEGLQGPVIEIQASCRLQSVSFVSELQKGLATRYGSENLPVGLGGVFLLQNGAARMHVMPDFSCKPLNSKDDVDSWLHFYEVNAPLVCVGTMVSHDPANWGLRVEHFHGWQNSSSEPSSFAGHYHCDTQADEASYCAYFVRADRLCRIDQPK